MDSKYIFGLKAAMFKLSIINIKDILYNLCKYELYDNYDRLSVSYNKHFPEKLHPKVIMQCLIHPSGKNMVITDPCPTSNGMTEELQPK